MLVPQPHEIPKILVFFRDTVVEVTNVKRFTIDADFGASLPDGMYLVDFQVVGAVAKIASIENYRVFEELEDDGSDTSD